MFKKLLVANRGEIALRVLRSCRELGIASVAVYSDVDRNSLHVRYADEAYLIGPGPARESYLNAAKIIEVATKAGVDAIHPGYGFLAENPDFAEACAQNGITFVGPTAQSIRLMGDKVQARRLMGEAGIPVVPGSPEIDSPDSAAEVAAQIGFPVLIKAAAGGGGKGIRAVYSPEEVNSAWEMARGEAVSSFGNPALYLEKFLTPVRHIEMQIIADNYGNVVALGERECSIQRRHQKMIEEAPSTAVDPVLRHDLAERAIAAAHAIGYQNVGTVEFLLDGEGKAYFLEMNTRLQVEHPVTELVTGVDLVADQILVAAGEKLPYEQSDINIRGWAIECRISTEDPFNDFLPSVGKVTLVGEPGGPGVRVDSALYDGIEIPIYYDPMVAKLSVWGRTRQEAIQRTRRALREFKIAGIHTNIPFHLYVMDNLDFINGRLDTSFVERQVGPSVEQGAGEEIPILAATLMALQRQRRRPASQNGSTAAPGYPWRILNRSAVLNNRQWAFRERGWQRNSS